MSDSPHNPRAKAFTDGVMALPADLVAVLQAEARARRRKPEALLREWLEDLVDGRAAERAMTASKGKPRVKAADLYRECGL